MTTNFAASRLTRAPETTAGIPPANAAAWAALTSIRHVAGSLDVSALEQSMIEDERSQLNISDDEAMIPGIAGGGDIEVPCDHYMHGMAGQAPADGSPVTEDELSLVLEECFGGVALGTSDELVAAGAHSTTAIELTDTLPVGTWVGLDDADSIVHLRRVESTAAGGVGVVHQLHRALPFTPADASLARGCAVYYLDEDVLEDSANGPTTTSHLIEKGRGSQRETWELRGCKSYLKALKLARNELAVASVGTKVGSFTTPDASPVPTHTTDPEGAAGSNVGPRTQVWIETRGTTTDTTVEVNGFELEPGMPCEPIPCITEDSTNMPGLYGYTLAKAPCTVAMTVIPYADSPMADFAARTEKSIQWERSAAAGSAWSVYMPRATHDKQPNTADASTVIGNALKFRAHYETGQTTAIARSRLQLIRC